MYDDPLMTIQNSELNGYGLIIGVGTYHDSAMNVPTAERDASGIYDAFTAPESGYPRAQFTLVLGGDATTGRITAELSALANRATLDSTVIISYTGHGSISASNLYYLSTADTVFSPSTQAIIDHTGFSISALAMALRTFQSRRVLVVINACGSGSLSRITGSTALSDTSIDNQQSESLVTCGRGRALVLASRSDELSYIYPQDTYSVMGQAIIDGIRGATTRSAGGYIGLVEWYEAVYDQVRRATTAVGHRQHPRLILMDGEGAFPIALHPSGGENDATAIKQHPSPNADVYRVTITAQAIGTAIGRDLVTNRTADIPPGIARVIDDQREATMRLVDVVLRQGDELRLLVSKLQEDVRESIQRVRDEVTIYRHMDGEKDKAWQEAELQRRETRQAETDQRDRRIIYALVALMGMIILLLVVLLIVR
jgi:hypothetical protein